MSYLDWSYNDFAKNKLIDGNTYFHSEDSNYSFYNDIQFFFGDENEEYHGIIKEYNLY